MKSILSRKKLDDVKLDDLTGFIEYFNPDKNNCVIEWYYKNIKLTQTKYLNCELIRNEDFSSQKIDPSYFSVPSLTTKPTLFKLYDTKIEPMLKFMHLRDISPMVGLFFLKENIQKDV